MEKTVSKPYFEAIAAELGYGDPETVIDRDNLVLKELGQSSPREDWG